MQHVQGPSNHLPSYMKILIRCLTSMLRDETTITKIFAIKNCRILHCLVQIMKATLEEEIVANSLKIIRYCIKEEYVSYLHCHRIPELTKGGCRLPRSRQLSHPLSIQTLPRLLLHWRRNQKYTGLFHEETRLSLSYKTRGHRRAQASSKWHRKELPSARPGIKLVYY